VYGVFVVLFGFGLVIGIVVCGLILVMVYTLRRLSLYREVIKGFAGQQRTFERDLRMHMSDMERVSARLMALEQHTILAPEEVVEARRITLPEIPEEEKSATNWRRLLDGDI